MRLGWLLFFFVILLSCSALAVWDGLTRSVADTLYCPIAGSCGNLTTYINSTVNITHNIENNYTIINNYTSNDGNCSQTGECPLISYNATNHTVDTRLYTAKSNNFLEFESNKDINLFFLSFVNAATTYVENALEVSAHAGVWDNDGSLTHDLNWATGDFSNGMGGLGYTYWNFTKNYGEGTSIWEVKDEYGRLNLSIPSDCQNKYADKKVVRAVSLNNNPDGGAQVTWECWDGSWTVLRNTTSPPFSYNFIYDSMMRGKEGGYCNQFCLGNSTDGTCKFSVDCTGKLTVNSIDSSVSIDYLSLTGNVTATKFIATSCTNNEVLLASGDCANITSNVTVYYNNYTVINNITTIYNYTGSGSMNDTNCSILGSCAPDVAYMNFPAQQGNIYFNGTIYFGNGGKIEDTSEGIEFWSSG